MSQLYILYESASGYCLFEKSEFDEAGSQLTKIQKSINDIDRFAKMVKLAAYQPFTTAEEALENIMAIRDLKVTPTLKNFLVTHLPATKSSKSQSNSKKTKKLAHTELDYYDKDIEQKIQKLPTLAEKLIAQAHLKSIKRSNSTLKK